MGSAAHGSSATRWRDSKSRASRAFRVRVRARVRDRARARARGRVRESRASCASNRSAAFILARTLVGNIDRVSS